MFFDNKMYFQFVDECKAAGINVPIIPGIKPLTTKRQASLLPSLFHIDVPEDLYDAVEKCKDNEAALQVGTEWCIQQSKELMESGVPCLHFYTMGKSGATKKVAEAIY
jgi:methylenetetrahydrofolate reductase (NADPH)